MRLLEGIGWSYGNSKEAPGRDLRHGRVSWWSTQTWHYRAVGDDI